MQDRKAGLRGDRVRGVDSLCGLFPFVVDMIGSRRLWGRVRLVPNFDVRPADRGDAAYKSGSRSRYEPMPCIGLAGQREGNVGVIGPR